MTAPHLRGPIIQAHTDTNGIPPARKPTADDLAGIEWWNAMTEQRRAYWLQIAKTNVPRHAWDHYKLICEIEGELR
jgi:hypothetical protein